MVPHRVAVSFKRKTMHLVQHHELQRSAQDILGIKGVPNSGLRYEDGSPKRRQVSVGPSMSLQSLVRKTARWMSHGICTVWIFFFNKSIEIRHKCKYLFTMRRKSQSL